MKINTQNIIELVPLQVYRKGLTYVKDDLVTLKNIKADSFQAVIEDAVEYVIDVQKSGDKFLYSCNCEEFEACEHVVAALATARDWYKNNQKKLAELETEPNWQDFFAENLSYQLAEFTNSQQWKVIYTLSFDAESWTIHPQRAYIKKDGTLGRFTNIGDFDQESSGLLYSANDPVIISYLQKLTHLQNAFYDQQFYENVLEGGGGKFHFKYGSQMGTLFELLKHSDVFKIEDDHLVEFDFEETPAKIEFRFDKENNHFILKPEITFDGHQRILNTHFHILTQSPTWMAFGHKLYKLENISNADLVIPFTKKPLNLKIATDEFPQFLEKVFPWLAKQSQVNLPESLNIRALHQITQPCLQLSEGEEFLDVSLKFYYDEHLVAYDDVLPVLFRKEGTTSVQIHRDKISEKKFWEALKATGPRVLNDGTLRVTETKAIDWMFANIPKFTEKEYAILGLEELDKFRIRTGEPNVKVGVSTNIDWFDVNMQIDVEGVRLQLKELKKAVRNNNRYVKLVDKSIAKLDDKWFKKFSYLFNFSQVDEEKVHVPKFNVTLIDMLFEELEFTQTDDLYVQSLERLNNFEGIRKQSAPPSLTPVLRDYQKAGFDWLNFLQEFSFGGCLADDMGLGKTVQTLALILNEKQKGNTTPCLIVCPTSVVFNWEKEVQKFTPELSVYLHTGNKRDDSTNTFAQYDIILTSYGIMRRDITMLKDFPFFYAILDESQKIKNPNSQTAKSARLINAKHRLILTGTPVENNTSELWSQFSFLNPGMLGSLSYFRRNFSTPIEKKNDTESADFLRQLIYPFILRRTKDSVAKELPSKFEQVTYCSMSPEQERLYDYWKDFYRAKILDIIDAEGMNKARMNVLEGLVKLRLISCHPYLVDTNVHEHSGKFEALMEFVEEILAENHKILIFSQFVKMLKIMRVSLEHKNIGFEYLDGHTRDRQACVERFQNDPDQKIFLISLKAGGTGLNLTAADYVIHYDPWWNPSVELQATDRAHRIGQDKNVFVYKMITKNSVEEKMLELQARKEKLVSDLVSTENGFLKNLTREYIDVLFG